MGLKKYSLWASLVLLACLLVWLKYQHKITQSTTKPSSLNEALDGSTYQIETDTVKISAKSSFESLLQVKKRHKQCLSNGRNTLKINRESNLELQNEIVNQLNMGLEWQTLVPLFLHSGFSIELLGNALRQQQESKLKYKFDNQQDALLLEQIGNSISSIGAIQTIRAYIDENELKIGRAHV